ncbi:hypothetical protein LSAT2_006686 [Lamellibrachia satsuma]|nr:hypothetical protein LSAT2_006686 [Lamellibrachia satsuma]
MFGDSRGQRVSVCLSLVTDARGVACDARPHPPPVTSTAVSRQNRLRVGHKACACGGLFWGYTSRPIKGSFVFVRHWHVCSTKRSPPRSRKESVIVSPVAPPVEDIATIARDVFDHWLVVTLAILATSLVCVNLVFFVYFQLAIHRNVMECRRRLSGELPLPVTLCRCGNPRKVTKTVDFVDRNVAEASKTELSLVPTTTTGDPLTDQLAKITQDLPEVNPREAAMRGFYLARVFRLCPLTESFANCRIGELLKRMAGIRESKPKPKPVVHFERSTTKPDASHTRPRNSGIRRSSVIVLTAERLCELHDVTWRRITVVNVVLTGTAWRRHCAKWTCLCGSAQLYNERAFLASLLFQKTGVLGVLTVSVNRWLDTPERYGGSHCARLGTSRFSLQSHLCVH